MEWLKLDAVKTTEIQKVKDYAAAHVLSVEEMLAILHGTRPMPSDNPNHVVMLNDYKCTFTVEQQPFGLTRRLSVFKPNDSPKGHVVNDIMGVFGMCDLLKAYKVWVETTPIGNAINAMELVK